MKKILEVLLYGDPDLRFDTDRKQANLPRVIPNLATTAASTMLSKLWDGGKEAAMAVYSNREEMIRQLKGSSRHMASPQMPS